MSEFILCLESATKVCSVALYDSDKLVELKEESSDKYIHSEKLAVFAKEVMDNAGITGKDLKAVAVSSGPGSYTGLRIGVSTAKGICFGSGIPLIAIPNLQQMAAKARAMRHDFDFYIPMLDARRLEVFSEVYDGELISAEGIKAVEIDEHSFEELKGKKIAIFGDGAAKCMETLEKNLTVELLDVHCSARNMGEIALEKWRNKEYED